MKMRYRLFNEIMLFGSFEKDFEFGITDFSTDFLLNY